MNARANTDDWWRRHIEDCRERFAIRNESGDWICKCGGELPHDDFRCATCKEKAKVEEEKRATEQRHRDFVRQVTERCQWVLQALPAWEHTKSPEAFASSIKDKSLRILSEKWTPENGSLLILGPSGSGKTSMVVRAIRRLDADRVKAVLADPQSREARDALDELANTKWTTASELVRALSQHPLGSRSEPELLQKCVMVRLLIIDELGPEASRYGGEIFDLIDRRYTRQLPTVVTSGLAHADFIARYGDALPRRLTEKGIGRLVNLHPQRGNVGK